MRPTGAWGVSLTIVLAVARSHGGAGYDPKDRMLVAHLTGQPAGKGFRISVEPGPIATRGLRIYSEPSKTLLLIVIDHAFRTTPAGAKWWADVAASKAVAVVEGTLPQMKPTIQLAHRPSADNIITLWVNGDWPDGVAEDRLIGRAHFSGSSFDFTIGVPNAITKMIR